MLGIFAGAPEVKSARVPQRVHAEVDLDLDAPDDRAHRAPVAWQLPPRLRFEPDSHPARPQHPLRPDLVAQNRELPRIPSSLELAEDHLCVPDAVAQQLIEVRAIGVKQPLRVRRVGLGAPRGAKARPTVLGCTTSCRATSQM